jgi:putative membrane protein
MVGSSHRQLIWTAATVIMGATVGIVACGSSSDSTGPVASVQQNAQIAASIRSDANIMGVLHTSNLGEIAAGNVARSKAVDAEVKSFATQMVADHSTLDAQGSALASAQGVVPVVPDNTLPQLMTAESDTLNHTPTSPAFDRTYIAQQVNDHVRTLALVDASIALTSNAGIKTFLQNTVRPGVAMHLQMAQTIQARIGRP